MSYFCCKNINEYFFIIGLVSTFAKISIDIVGYWFSYPLFIPLVSVKEHGLMSGSFTDIHSSIAMQYKRARNDDACELLLLLLSHR